MNEQRVVNAKVVGNKGNIWNKILLAIVLVCIGAAGMYAVIKLNPGTTIVNKLEKEVTVNENGIADAVEKVYNSVVVVENYRSNKLQATGTGFIFKKDGNKYYVMTNYHVIESSSKVKIVLTDNTNTEVEVVGGDKYADIAVLSFTSSSDLTAAEIGSSTDGRVGDTTFAVGAPLDSSTYSWTVTRGILSGKDRMVAVSTTNSTSSDYIMRVLQTDAAINSGNSGGGMFDANGNLIGIVNAKDSGTTSSGTTIEGLGFAIPINEAMNVAKQLIESGQVTDRPTIGVTLQTITKDYGNYKAGLYITDVSKGSGAEAAGLQPGDQIVGADGTEIASYTELSKILRNKRVGDILTLTIVRDGEQMDVDVTLTGALTEIAKG